MNVRGVRIVRDVRGVRIVPVVRGVLVVRIVLLLALCGGFIGCRPRGESRESAPATAPQLADISLPELARVDAPVQAQIRARYESVTRMLASGNAPRRDLGTAFGEYGMLLH